MLKNQVRRGDTALHLAADLTSALIRMKTKPALFDDKLARQLSGAADADESRKWRGRTPEALQWRV